mmetsp:Transcript_68479/g.198636  ORF Transcript_68479/g.198636 Transcript_68479/m.198636 type:complete len:98 (+) Transcript_68479:113-406(+)
MPVSPVTQDAPESSYTPPCASRTNYCCDEHHDAMSNDARRRQDDSTSCASGFPILAAIRESRAMDLLPAPQFISLTLHLLVQFGDPNELLSKLRVRL